MKQSRKTVDERQKNILNEVMATGEIKVEDIAKAYNISTMTVRRDLKQLEDRQLIARTHGGAISMERYISKKSHSSAALRIRNSISSYAASLVNDGEKIFINGSRTALGMLYYMGDKNIQVFTNNGWAIGEEFPPGVDIYFTGGEMRGHLMVGDYCMRFILDRHADKTFIGCAAVYDDGEFRYDIPTEIGINEAMISRTQNDFYVLADHTKFFTSENRENLYGSSIFERPCTLITDSKTDPRILDKLGRIGMKIIVV